MRKQTQRRWNIAGISLIVILALIWGCECAQRRSAIAATREWARLAPFPKSAGNFTLSSEGSMFTRGFRVSFTASAQEIARWVQASPGMQGLSPERDGRGLRKYVIAPGDGATYAEVVIDDRRNVVRVYTYWS